MFLGAGQAGLDEDATSAPSGSSFEPFSQSYIDANFGLANIDGEFVFPGDASHEQQPSRRHESFLVGKRMFVSQRVFVDGQLGLAFPNVLELDVVLTAKSPAVTWCRRPQVGVPANGWSVAAGLRTMAPPTGTSKWAEKTDGAATT